MVQAAARASGPTRQTHPGHGLKTTEELGSLSETKAQNVDVLAQGEKFTKREFVVLEA